MLIWSLKPGSGRVHVVGRMHPLHRDYIREGQCKHFSGSEMTAQKEQKAHNHFKNVGWTHIVEGKVASSSCAALRCDLVEPTGREKQHFSGLHLRDSGCSLPLQFREQS